jgi:DNA-binding transcriptional ArsR family regulator
LGRYCDRVRRTSEPDRRSVLKRAGLVDCRRSGLNVYYRIIDEGVFTICRNVCDSLELRVDQERQTIRLGKQEIADVEAGLKIKA